MTGYDRKTVRLSADQPTTISAEIDVTGTGVWQTWREFELTKPGETITYDFPESLHAYWIRFISSKDATVTAQLDYR